MVITGTPGVGKSTISKIIAQRLQGIHIDCGRVALNGGMTIEYDEKKETHTIDERLLSRRLKEIVAKYDSDIILEGHFIPRISGFKPERVFVLRCHPRKIIDRLEEKSYSKRKIAENVAAEILDFCLNDAIKVFDRTKIFEIDNSKNRPNLMASMILSMLEGKIRRKSKHIDWISKLEKEESLQEILKYIEN
ncbi:MAG: adenylate kinase family protein [Candidatus Bathyarchaeia archaeon]|jgi:adenylate kinase|nr:adenylate kinase family protein [Candidatus Bathyarchaeota archaeon]